MKQNVRTYLIFIIAGIFCAWYWYNSVTIVTQESQWNYAIISLLLLATALIFRKKLSAKYNNFDPWVSIITLGALYILLFFTWNYLFRWYSDSHDFQGNIFRGAFYGFRGPFYGHLYDEINKNISSHWPAIVTAILFLVFIFMQNINFFKSKQRLITGVFTALFILSFSWHDSLQETFLGTNCHYGSIAADLPRFSTVRSVLTEYNGIMHELSVHNNHYPPGYLLILKLEELYWPYLSKTIVFLATFLALFPFVKLMKLLGFNERGINISLILYASSGAILFYPGIAMDPLMLPLAVSGVYLMLQYLRNRKIINPILFAAVIAVYSFFTFTSLVFGLFCGCILLYKLLFKEATFRSIIKFGSLTIIFLAGILWLTDLIFHFNILDCFFKSYANEKLLMSYSGINSWSRYLIVSSGNIIAYIGIIGIPAIGVIFHRLRQKQNKAPVQIRSLTYALITAVVLLGFSNQFYLEIERIWIFLTPFILLVSGWFINSFDEEKKFSIAASLLMTTLLVSLLLSVAIDHCY